MENKDIQKSKQGNQMQMGNNIIRQLKLPKDTYIMRL